MNKFSLQTNRYYFGKGAIVGLVEVIQDRKAKRVLLTYGGGSIKKIGLYDEIKKILAEANVKVFEHSGVQPNPLNTHTTEGGVLARQHKVDLIIAAGGGSTIDAAKIMAVVATNENVKDSWDLITRKETFKNAPLPLISIITLAGTASENNAGSVLTNAATQEKNFIFTVAPIAAIEDPTYTFSVSPYQTASGIFDTFSHLLETYYIQNKGDDFEWTNQYIFANLRILLNLSATVIKEPNNYDARANILWATSFSLNGLNSFNFQSFDGKVHAMEHAVSAIYDVAHGAGLALLTPTYLELMVKQNPLYKERTARLAKELFGLSTATDFINELKKFIKDTLHLPTKWTDFSEIKAPLTKAEIEVLLPRVFNMDQNLAREVFTKVKC